MFLFFKLSTHNVYSHKKTLVRFELDSTQSSISYDLDNLSLYFLSKLYLFLRRSYSGKQQRSQIDVDEALASSKTHCQLNLRAEPASLNGHRSEAPTAVGPAKPRSRRFRNQRALQFF